MPLLALLALFSLPSSANASTPPTEVRGRVFYDKLSAVEPSFYFTSIEKELDDGKRLVTAVYTDKEGKELLREENFFDGAKLTRSVYKQNQVNERGEVNMKDGKAVFTFTDHKGTETESEDIVPNMILGSMIAPHVMDHWKELMAGESVKVRYMAIERCETVGFKFFKERERMLSGKAVVDFTMKPSSFLISAIVNPIRLTFTKDEPRYLVEVEGRTPIRWPKTEPPKDRSDWKAIDARIEFDFPKQVAAPEAKEPAADPNKDAPAAPANPAPKLPKKKHKKHSGKPRQHTG